MKTVINNKEFWLHNGPLVTKDHKYALRPACNTCEFTLFVHDVRFFKYGCEKPVPRDGDEIFVHFDLLFERCAISDNEEFWDNSGSMPLRSHTFMDKGKGFRQAHYERNEQFISIDDMASERLSWGKGLGEPEDMIALFKMIKKNRIAIIDAVNIAIELQIKTVGLKHKQL